ncbi:Rap/ran-GAP [Geosmithia morbida]|uniref:Rap/ran-GAP n=1 Tax=Geosmithia morbida TaxID=1094350 RepID=A0A9P4YND1_9HYPO|nr:Rap/ran-GAP [Geosmithia morbida]KAF4119637.1 Rap/ran-GAP [Geosmithia morbida]
MSPQGGDDVPSPDSSRATGLANVFRGLTASRSSRSLPLSSSSSSVALPVAELVNATPDAGGHSMSAGDKPAASTMDSYDLLKSGSLNDRIAAATNLKLAISEYPLNPILDIWYAARDLIEPANPPSARTAGWELLSECAKHNSSTDLERKEFFQTLTAPANPHDFHLQLAALVDLTHSGRALNGFDYDLVPLLTVWLQDAYKAVRNARKTASTAKGSKGSTKTKTVVLGEEKNFTQLFTFLIDILKFSFKCVDDVSLAGLIDGLLNICMSTSVEEDLRCCISVLDALVTFGTIPNDKLKGCIHVLSSIFCLVPSLQKESWHTLANFFRSHNGQATVRILLDVLRGLLTDPEKEKDLGREIRSSLAVLQKLLSKTAEKGYPPVPFALLADGLRTAVKASSSTRVYVAILRMINYLFCDQNGQMHRLIIDEDWSIMLQVAADCAAKLGRYTDSQPARFYDNGTSDDPIGKEVRQLISRLETIVANHKTATFVPRRTVIKLFVDVYHLLPDSAARTVLEYFQEFRSCSPSDIEWEKNLTLVLDGFFSNRNRSSETRLQALRTIMDAYEILDLISDDSEQDSIPRLARNILKDIVEETDVPVLDAVMSLMVSVVTSCDMELFEHIVTALRGIVDNNALRAPMSPGILSGAATASPGRNGEKPQAGSSQSPSNVVSRGFVKMFVQVMNQDGAKGAKLFDALVYIARLSHCEMDARLTAMKLLFRLRADWANMIFVTRELETNYVAPTLLRTDDSLAKKQAEDAARMSRGDHGNLARPTRGLSVSHNQGSEKALSGRVPSGSGSKGLPTAHYDQLWKLPDPDALPPNVPTLTSPVLSSFEAPDQGGATESEDPEEGQGEDGREGDDDDDEDEEEADEEEESSTFGLVFSLNMHSWLEAVLSILKGSDWEIYSFVLVHLPSQLSNHGVFKGAIKQIQDLRKLICEHVQTNSFHEPPNACGLRRADVAICLFHSLTMILSYHEHFQKGDEDDIVKTYVYGIRAWVRTAPCCIHALTICCHELPLSASKSLGQMLNQMAAIITQPDVAIHILEFLASLSRLRDVYVNFRDDEYRTVFGICFRYLEYARDKRQSNRASYASEGPSAPSAGGDGTDPGATHPNASDDLPQYVYTLTYQVIFFWFLALKLPDRATHVGTVTKKLFADTDSSGNVLEEQALIALDFMQRTTYADVDESKEDPTFNEERFGEMATRRWVVGNSIISIKQSVRTGWAQITKRQPSGTSSYMVHEYLLPRPLHHAKNPADMGRDGQESDNTILPSHLMVQLMASLPQPSYSGDSSVSSRPVPLPDDEATDRTLRVIDLTPTVDGHKVGVIYIGEGQTEETEILANVSGSSDYVEFLNNLGTLTRLKGATFNTQGLDREMDIDGPYAFCWRDRLTEIMFHVTTQMPTNLEFDPQVTNKKRHIGNDYVNIIFNDSGLPFRFDTFPSQFNYVNIVITPASRASFMATREAQAQTRAQTQAGTQDGKRQKQHGQPFYRVQVMSKPGFPRISPASEIKMVSLKALPDFIRLVALNASVFSLVWQNRSGGEYVSAWRSRLREIRRLRERHGPPPPHPSHTSHPHTLSTGASAPTAPQQHQPQLVQPQQLPASQATASTGTAQHPQLSSSDASRPGSSMRDSFTSLRRTSVATFFTSSTSEQTSHRSSMLSGPTGTSDTEITAQADGLSDSVDFSKWA